MTADRTPTVDHATLTLGRQLGQGGQGTVYEVPHKKINQAHGDGWDVVYKEYRAEVLPQLDAAALAARVALLGELDATDGRWLCEKTAWPAAVVERGGNACGFLMRAVPDRFRFTLRSLHGSSGTRRLANLEYLLNEDGYVAGIGLSISERDRLLLLADLAATLDRFHRIGITVGDLSPKNLLFTTAPRPECFLIDSDAMGLRGTTVLPQAETPDWQVPNGEERATRAGDVHKLGLLAVRLFAREQTTTDPAALAGLSAALGDLARASHRPDPAQRPTPSQWAEQLTAASATASTLPAKGAPTRRRAGRPGGPPPPRPRTPNRPPGQASGPGTTPSATKPPARAAAAGLIVAAVAVLVALLIPHGNDSSDTNANSSSTYTTSPADTPTGTEPAWMHTTPYTPATTYAPTTYAPPGTFSPPPYTYSPVPYPTTAPAVPPPPPTDYFGAIAVGTDGGYGTAWNYHSMSGASQGALSRCSSYSTGCKVLTAFENKCGAFAYNSATRQYWGGSGATRAEAESNAISHAGGGRWITSVCTTGS
ncbi:DUF4189 domain-containing protein [Streptomyces sp. NPDC056149]|uniref:DUF4189 domain-containing protein n=1 Tax=Streptomyces sp. NPDC056149 TaxID=3345728 RepID=UPI0035D699BE